MKNELNQHPMIGKYIEHNEFGKLLGMDFEILEPGVVRYNLTVEKKHLATPRAIHGGCTAALIDATMGVGALSLVLHLNQVVATLELKVSYLNSIPEGKQIYCISEKMKEGKDLIFMEATVLDESGKKYARGSGTFVKSIKFEK
ncbi:MAG: hypothetical protein RL264_1981 [Bacteroidota bacterium]